MDRFHQNWIRVPMKVRALLAFISAFPALFGIPPELNPARLIRSGQHFGEAHLSFVGFIRR